MDRMERADAIVQALETHGHDGWQARVWEGREEVRVYVSRALSRGRRQEMGYVEIPEEGEPVVVAQRQASTIRRAVAEAA